ncbi:multiple sugar transport system permease protein [Caldanaerobius fijiensis DSM 17918]|uniref:Multiple sugar transport system permease protein n=1 Tax=Caldanaerobius fijiensis DSM 17918 TaxID=1121256 RepID=A0A1M5BCF8_9THEO|nr:carbohydrate ABC transporter permease [Caldanaerobius fijiensis]SHF39832.1 multiple sugar transport system permease protein [Caldanaerobius fijiensis DSM 17918]
MENIILEKPNNIQSRESKVNISTGIIYVFLIIMSIISFLPFYIMIINSTHSNDELATKLLLLPGNSLIANYTRMVQNINIWRGFLNSVIIAVSCTVLSGYFSALTAYGFSKYKFKGNSILFWFILATMMIPGQLGLVGYFQLVKSLGLLDTYWPLILPSIASASSVFWIRQYIDSSVQDSLIESARIDGCGEFMIFNKIILPLIVPAIATISIFTFVGSWNNYLAPLVLIFSQDKFPLPVLVAMMKGYYSNDYGAMYLGVAISVVPIMIAFFFFSKHIVGGLTVGSIKG